MVTSSQDKKKFMDAVKEASNSLTRIEAERDLLKEISKNLKDEYELPKRIVNKIIRTYHKQNYTEETQEFEEFSQLYEAISGNATLSP